MLQPTPLTSPSSSAINRFILEPSALPLWRVLWSRPSQFKNCESPATGSVKADSPENITFIIILPFVTCIGHSRRACPGNTGTHTQFRKAAPTWLAKRCNSSVSFVQMSPFLFPLHRATRKPWAVYFSLVTDMSRWPVSIVRVPVFTAPEDDFRDTSASVTIPTPLLSILISSFSEVDFRPTSNRLRRSSSREQGEFIRTRRKNSGTGDGDRTDDQFSAYPTAAPTHTRSTVALFYPRAANLVPHIH